MSNFGAYRSEYDKIIKEQNEGISEDLVFRLSNDISDEFTKTVNSFTSICAQIVKKRGASEDLYERFQNSYSKIKNLIDAAKNTNHKP